MQLGPVLDIFYFLSSLFTNPGKTPAPPSSSLPPPREIVWSQPRRSPSTTVTAFIDVNIIPMDSARVLPNQTVLIEGGRITTLGPTTQIQVPATAIQIEGKGKYLIPGLGDCHVHIGHVLSSFTKRLKQQRLGVPPDSMGDERQLPPDSLAERRLFTWLADGVTTIRNLDYMDRGEGRLLDSEDLLRLRARAAAGELLSPRIYTAGRWAPRQYTHSGSERFDTAVPRLDSVATYVAAYKKAGYDVLKIHDESPEVWAAVLIAARQVGIPVVGHVPRGVSLKEALAGRMNSIEHLIGYDGVISQRPGPSVFAEIATATQRAGTWNCVTMHIRRGKGHLIKSLQNAGAGVLLGTDDPVGRGIHQELEELVDSAGLTPYEALATGTKNMAAYLGTTAEAGTIAVGKQADLVLLRGNPFENIRHTRQPAGVMLGGRWLARAELDRRLTAIAASGGAGLPGHNYWTSAGPTP